jgi:Asp-tRNA(Asn)/Glu-tRNA(Gln) amidotransferase B subunit
MPRDKNLEDIVNDVVSENTSDLLAIQGGAGGRSIDKLVVEVMHRSRIKTDPRNIRRLILAKIA